MKPRKQNKLTAISSDKAETDLQTDLAKTREIVGMGGSSIIFDDGSDYVLKVTSPKCGANIQRVIDALSKVPAKNIPRGLTVPTLITKNFNFSQFFPQASRAHKIAELNGKPAFQTKESLWHNNLVFRLPRYEGRVDIFKALDGTLIDKMYRSILGALSFLHKELQLTHNDIAMRNIFFVGQIPGLHFYLGDYGNVSTLTASKHELDLDRLLKVRQQMLTTSVDYRRKKAAAPSAASSPICKPDQFLLSGQSFSPGKYSTRSRVKAMLLKVETSGSRSTSRLLFSESEDETAPAPAKKPRLR